VVNPQQREGSHKFLVLGWRLTRPNEHADASGVVIAPRAAHQVHERRLGTVVFDENLAVAPTSSDNESHRDAD
jgi:hypothetical protein